jgi:uncharacterized HAD superfamily protein
MSTNKIQKDQFTITISDLITEDKKYTLLELVDDKGKNFSKTFTEIEVNPEYVSRLGWLDAPPVDRYTYLKELMIYREKYYQDNTNLGLEELHIKEL